MVRIGRIIPKWPKFSELIGWSTLQTVEMCFSKAGEFQGKVTGSFFLDEIASIAITSVAKLKSAARCPTCQTYSTYRRLAEDGVRSNEQRMVLRPLATSKSLEPLGIWAETTGD